MIRLACPRWRRSSRARAHHTHAQFNRGPPPTPEQVRAMCDALGPCDCGEAIVVVEDAP